MGNETIDLPTPELRLSAHSEQRDWGRALRAVVRLAHDTEDTGQVFEIIHALSGNNIEYVFARFRAEPNGERLLRERPRLNDILRDQARLERMPEGSLGREYVAFMRRGGITATGLFEAQSAAAENDGTPLPEDPDRRYVAERLVEQHDLWHVLTGYGRDDTGELANLWFSYGQFRQPGMGFIALLGTLDGPLGRGWLRFMLRAYQRGRKAVFLAAAPMEELLELPIDEARRRLGISLPATAHPGGIRTGNRRDRALGQGPRSHAA